MLVRRLAILCACSFAFGCGDDEHIVHPSSDMAVSVGSADMAAATTMSKCSAGTPRKLSDLPGDHLAPRIAWNGSGFVVAWTTSVGGAARIDVAVTDPLGTHTGPNLPLSSQPVADESPPSLAPLVNGTVIAWTRSLGGKTDVVIDTLDSDGERLDAFGRPCDPSVADCGIFAVTDSGSASFPALGAPQRDRMARPTDANVGLAFIDARNHCGNGSCDALTDVFWERVQGNGAIIDPAVQITPIGSNVQASVPRMAFDGTNDGLIWRDDTSSATQFLFATVAGDGSLVSGPGLVGSASGESTVESVPDLVYSSGSYALASATGDASAATVVLQRFAADGTALLTPTAITFGRNACEPALAWDGVNYAVVWQAPCNQAPANIGFVLVDQSGVRVQKDGTSCGSSLVPSCGVLEITDIVPGALASAAAPAIAWAGDGFGIVWQQQATSGSDAGGSPDDIWFARVDCVSP